MCGFAGIWRGEGLCDDATETVARMTAALAHRGPDDSGLFVDPAAGIALGHRRLAVLDLSPAGHQPMKRGRLVIVYNGEIYNLSELRDGLTAAGERFRGRSDTEVLLAAVERWGLKEALQRSVGMFSFALWDDEARTLWLVRDRMGEKPLYYGALDRGLGFGSELGALLAHPRFHARIDRDALALYLRHGHVPSPYAIFAGVRKLPPGHILTVCAGREPALSAYWSASDMVRRAQAEPLDQPDDVLVDALDALVGRAVKQAMASDVPIGAFLSGGIDSSLVVALMQEVSSRPVRTFTIGFHERDHDEAAHARAVARHLQTEHVELYVTPAEARATVAQLGTLYDEPFADSSQIPTTLLAALTRRHVTVSLSGDGGDELFGGYNRYLWGSRLAPLLRSVPPGPRLVAADLLRRASPERWDALAHGVERLLPQRLRVALPGAQLHKLAGVLGVETPEALYRALVASCCDAAALVLGARELPTALDDPAPVDGLVERMMFLDLTTYLPDDNLVKLDRASMAVGLEARAPLIDHRLAAFAWRLPLRCKLRGGQGKWLLRQVLYRRVPRVLIERPKMGFGVPIASWLRGPLRAWAHATLERGTLLAGGYFDADAIASRWQEHLTGKRDWSRLLWAVLMFESWREGLLRRGLTERGQELVAEVVGERTRAAEV